MNETTFFFTAVLDSGANAYATIFAALFVLSCASWAHGYLTGNKHGRDEGRLEGSNAMHQEMIPRVMRAKLDGPHLGNIQGQIQAMESLGLCNRTFPPTIIANLQRENQRKN